MKKPYLIPNMVTALGLSCGLFVIFKVITLSGDFDIYKVLKKANFFLLLAALADLLDGIFAKIFKAESDFGIMFDSLADSISFGVAPSVLLIKSLTIFPHNKLSFLVTTTCMIFSICGVLRLVRYNTNNARESLLSMGKNFTGLPIPAAALAATSLNSLFVSPIFKSFIIFNDEIRAIICSFSMIILGYLMVCRWKFPGLNILNFRLPSFYLAFFTGLIAIFFLHGVLHYFPVILVILFWGYIFVAVTLSLIRLLAGKKSAALKDFEPEPDE